MKLSIWEALSIFLALIIIFNAVMWVIKRVGDIKVKLAQQQLDIREKEFRIANNKALLEAYDGGAIDLETVKELWK